MHTCDEEFKCHLCQSSFKHECDLRSHLVRNHGIKPPANYTCRFCQKKLETKFYWARHELRHTGWKYYKCVKCDREFLGSTSFARHVYGKTKSDCPTIKGMTKEEEEQYRTACRKDWVSDHKRILGKLTNFDLTDSKIKTLGAPVYKCRFCQKEHDKKILWALHELKHTGWKYYKCAKCGWEVSDGAAFCDHVTDTIRKRKFDQTNCTGVQGMTSEEEKTFRKKSRKNWESEHARILGTLTTFNENDFTPPKRSKECRFCSKIIEKRRQLAMHELRHTGWNSHKCIKCGRACGNAASFSNHANRRYKSQQCPGGVGLSKEELKIYWKQSSKDWHSAYAKILGDKAGAELDELVKNSGFKRVLPVRRKMAKTKSKRICQESDGVPNPIFKECRVVLTRLNVITVHN